MKLVGIILLILTVNSNGKCFYNTLFKEVIPQTDEPTGNMQLPFSLVLANKGDVGKIDTEQKCIDFCRAKPWCMAVSDLVNTPLSELRCQFITSWQTIGFPQPKCNSDFNILNCELSNNTLISIDNDVFFATSIENEVGSTPTGHVIPSNLFELSSTNSGEFCHILKTDNEVISTRATVFTDYYTTSPIVFNGIVKYGDIQENPPSRGDPNVFARRGTSLAHSGFPIVGIEVMENSPYPNARDHDKYRLFRHELLEVTECSISRNISKPLISPEERIDTENSFFTISATKKDGTDLRYLSCQATEDDNAFACSWKTSPDMVWRMGAFEHPGETENDSTRGGQKRTFIAYDINNLDNELGWLDVSHCDDVNKNGKDQIRLLHGGKKGGTFHCGIGNWRFQRGEIAKSDIFIIDHGTFLMWHHRKHPGGLFPGEIDSLTTFVRQAPNISPGNTDARTCGKTLNGGDGGAFSCNDNNNDERARMMRLEPVFKSTDTNTLFSIQSGENHMHCPKDGSTCFWAAPGTHKKHYFKTYSYGIGKSIVTSLNELGNTKAANNNIIVYEEIGGFMIAIGYLSEADFLPTDIHNFYLSQKPNNFYRHINTNGLNNLILDTTHVITTLFQDKKLVNGNVGEQVLMKALSFQESTATLVPVNDNAELDNEHYHWILNAHESKIDNMFMCPEGEYLHQVHCKNNQLCEHVDIACVKPTSICAVDTNVNATIVKLEQLKFAKCPANTVVVGMNATHMSCKNISITSTIPAGHRDTNFSPIGFLTNPTFVASKASRPTEITFNGKPFQAIHLRNEKEIELWNYGRQCRVPVQDSQFRNLDQQDAFHIVTQKGDTARCDTGRNEYVSHVFCIDNDANCFKGIGLTCDAAKTCEFTGELIRRSAQSSAETLSCPFGSVITGIKCIQEAIGSDPLPPCAHVEIECMKVQINPGFDPEKPSKNNNGDDKSTTRAILIGLGVGIPLLVVAAIACLCLLPDETILSTNNVPVSESARVKDYELVDMDDLERPGIRHRRKF